MKDISKIKESSRFSVKFNYYIIIIVIIVIIIIVIIIIIFIIIFCINSKGRRNDYGSTVLAA